MQPQTQNINYEEYKRVSEFKYLFSLDSYDNDCEKKFEREWRQRIEATRLPKKLWNHDTYQNTQNQKHILQRLNI
jgi:hypothetical protein